MASSLLRMLAAIMCALATANVVPVQDFELEKMAGKWYIVAMASDAQWFVNNKAEMKMGTVVLAPTAEGNLNISFANRKADGSCWRQNHLANKTDSPRHFVFHSSVWNNDNDMHIVKVQYDDYALVSTNKTRDGVSVTLSALYKRNQEVSEELQQEFKEFSLEREVQADNIVILPKYDECSEA
ncbi:lipocalin-like [Solea solea]|uniref:lipocalin-like n=1 Tax=Solea solea TaxID=90069 RepID=UPI00272B3649|nr:lipocalin-like [Solea solea]